MKMMQEIKLDLFQHPYTTLKTKWGILPLIAAGEIILEVEKRKIPFCEQLLDDILGEKK